MASLQARLLSIQPAPQAGRSPLFGLLPAEVRYEIFACALTDYPDPSPAKRYDVATCYTRPTYFAPRRTDTALLRTCRAVYAECWYLAFILREQTHWLSSHDRAPPEYSAFDSGHQLRRVLAEIARQQGREVEIESLRVFAQMYRIEDGSMERLLRKPGLYPRRLVLTVRHTDWWFWEDDEPLRFAGGWITGVNQVLPASVREVCIELESLKRKTQQIDEIAAQMCKNWFFKRQDGIALYPDSSGKLNTASTWSGSSKWHGKQWTRDETEPGRIDYHIVSVTFLQEHMLRRRGGLVAESTKQRVVSKEADGCPDLTTVQATRVVQTRDVDWDTSENSQDSADSEEDSDLEDESDSEDD